MSAMGDRLLLLEDTADALDVIDPELARQFRLVNGLPYLSLEDWPSSDLDVAVTAPAVHVATIDERPETIRVTCSCGGWQSEVAWDDIDDMVTSARDHFGPDGGAVLGQPADDAQPGGIRRVS